MDSAAWKALEGRRAAIEGRHLRELLADPQRCAKLRFHWQGATVDLARQRVDEDTLELLFGLAEERQLQRRIAAMFAGEPINLTEHRAVLHTALRADDRPEVVEVRQRINAFAEKIRSGERRGITGKTLVDTVAIGIGGSFLGPEFMHEALRTDIDAGTEARGRRLRFLSNVDPIDISRALEGLNPETTAVVIISKTFTTAETLLNARSLRRWLVAALGEAAVPLHMFAVSTNLPAVAAFGIDPENAFGFWDWVGGRYSVTSAVGLVPLTLQYGSEVMARMLAGAHAMDQHFLHEPLRSNLPVLLGLIGVWNTSFLGYPVRALLPYCQALHRLPAHIQQVSMESNGKGVTAAGVPTPWSGPIEFGEPGTNGQHSFYQMLHQGRAAPADFLGFRKSQRNFTLPGETISNHDELMANFFAQPDALAIGKTAEELAANGMDSALIPHRTFLGNRPSSVLLFDRCDPHTIGVILALYEHRTAVEGFLWELDSFDQWGVELGKVLAGTVRQQLTSSIAEGAAIHGFNPSTTALLQDYLEGR